MAKKITLKRSNVNNKVPTTTDLDLGEVGINTYDGKMFIKKDDGTASIIEIGYVKSVDDLTDVDTTTSAPSNGEVLAWDGTNWVPTADSDTTYSAGTGLSLTGTTFALNASIDDLTDVDTTTSAPSNQDLLQWDGSNWVPYSVTENDFTATSGQTVFTVSNIIFSYARVYTNGVRDKASTFSISDNGTDTTVTFTIGKNLNDWVMIEV